MTSPGAGGVGSWPGTSAREALRTVADLVGGADNGIPYLPETPARGPGADMIGRGAALLVEMPVDLQPSGWRLTDGPGRDARRARSFLGEDLDELAEAYDGWTGPLKLQVAGPWSLAASIALPRGERAVHDPGATRDLVASLTEGLRLHLSDVARLVPGARLIVQLDEPSLPAVLAGTLPTASGFGRLRAVEPEVVRAGLVEVMSAAPDAVESLVHCCAPTVPVSLLHEAGAGGIALDLGLLEPSGWDQLGEAIEAGVRLWAGVIPTGGEAPRPDTAVRPLVAAWDRLGLDSAHLERVVVTPTCGLAGAEPGQAVRAQRAAVAAAGVLAEQLA